jgi:hypothetical protein
MRRPQLTIQILQRSVGYYGRGFWIRRLVPIHDFSEPSQGMCTVCPTSVPFPFQESQVAQPEPWQERTHLRASIITTGVPKEELVQILDSKGRPWT